ncbi:MAG TPA: hypothetical protein VF230_16230 [Acidimicrobiales bacterium]
MIALPSVVALDGHDGSGKTTLARGLAASWGGTYGRPFGGARGSALLRAGERGDVDAVVALGEEGLRAAVEESGGARPLVLDRAWMTVASLVDWDAFASRWQWWVPTVLCWADLDTTLARVGARDEHPMPRSWHEHYLQRYLALAETTNTYVLRTDLESPAASAALLEQWASAHLQGAAGGAI